MALEIVNFPMNSMVVFHSYVSFPGGIYLYVYWDNLNQFNAIINIGRSLISLGMYSVVYSMWQTLLDQCRETSCFFGEEYVQCYVMLCTICGKQITVGLMHQMPWDFCSRSHGQDPFGRAC